MKTQVLWLCGSVSREFMCDYKVGTEGLKEGLVPTAETVCAGRASG